MGNPPDASLSPRAHPPRVLGRSPRLAALFALVVLLTVGTARVASKLRERNDERLQAALLREIDALRTSRGLAQLRLNASLEAASAAHSHEMAAGGYFGHRSLDGSDFWTRVQSYYCRRPVPRCSAGENLLWASSRIGAHAALRAWLQRPAHRANLLRPGWRDVGISVLHPSAARGIYRGRRVTIITMDFGTRSSR